MRQWRLIRHQASDGAYNMAVDEAILQQVSAGDAPPTLRLYAWQPLCLSLGYGQRLRDVDQQALQRRGWGLVRRPTGGKAILHGDELTYSIALPRDHELAAGDVVASYRRISRALMHALQQLGLTPQSEQQAKGNRGLGPVCFEVPSHYEITAAGKKLMGSAQVRRRMGLLQHGTLPLYGDITRICDALAYNDETERQTARAQVAERATTLASVLTAVPTWTTVADAIVTGFRETFDITFVTDDLTVAEAQRADELIETQFAHPDWTAKR